MKNSMMVQLLSMVLFSGLEIVIAQPRAVHHLNSLEKIITLIYGPVGIQITPIQHNKIEQLLHDLYDSSPRQLYSIAQWVIIGLKELKQQTKELMEELSNEKEIVSQKQFLTLFCLNEQINYLENYKKKLYEKFSMLEKLECSFERNFKKLSSWIKGSDKNGTVSWEETVADRIVDYIEFERENILFDYTNLLIFFAGIKKSPLPSIINFWADKELQRKLILRSRRITSEVKVQFLEEIFMIALQSYIMAGGSMYTQWLDQADADAFAELTKKQNKIQTDFQTYIQQVNATQKKVMDQIINGFKTGMQGLFADYKTVNEQQQKEQVYLFKSINLDYPIQHALTWPPVPYDQVFQAGLMGTPKGGQWFNIYQYGDWEFDAQRNSFWQNGLIPFGTPFWQATETTDKSTISDPSQNSIFTEYISNDASYNIVVECTLINCTYPFFVGVMFNRARWISGDPERLWQYRLFGLYGHQTTANEPSTRSINLGFAQQIITTEDKKEKIISPLEQIISSNKMLPYALPKADVDFLVKDSITFVFDITINIVDKTPSEVVLNFSKKNGPQLYRTTISNLNPYLAIFNGIGFMASGCQAEFKIIKPEKLVYSTDDLKEFLSNEPKQLLRGK